MTSLGELFPAVVHGIATAAKSTQGLFADVISGLKARYCPAWAWVKFQPGVLLPFPGRKSMAYTLAV